MIAVITNVTGIENELGEIIRLFYHDQVVYEERVETDHVVRHLREGQYHRIWMDDALLVEYPETPIGEITGKRLVKYTAKLGLYWALVKKTGREQPWGSLTGVRPVKMLAQLMEMGLPGERVLQETFGVSQCRAALSRMILAVQEDMAVPEHSIGVYLGIPFCVSRCNYCSFPGVIAKESVHEAYVDAMILEMEAAAEAIQERGLAVNSLYIGGGTPTSLNPALLERLLSRASELFSRVEFTMEAGRPDTITREKLLSARTHGVTRLCINPQTMNGATLATITRSHQPEDIVAAYALARELGFDHINADLIAGLTGEGYEAFCYTVSEVLKLAPESITIHTLALKRGSKLADAGYQHQREEEVARMVDYGRETLMDRGYRPYYLYRQKYMAGNLENVGYALPHKECLYNVCMMDDLSSVLALGAGAITKILTGSRIQRYPNPKDVKLYLERIDAIRGKYREILR
ncbi:coproporphyrinogen dehydrogenase HemZ [Christensenella sp. MSJ-20]|uniref:coproporphyrinogen dehydrogenase HemZ n=1 Tax=Christensenella sp. MSJ-20 TaxID=2841518 RepID=UPI001C7677EF|nr:coproporphyrinogen dehydrogenase HemZ [Christensenella sp. MSJ-20]